ncbi:MAG: hypothetical protein Q8Q09_11495 [Deltaproteobacteria bacterium]|nr:hypothetical protein [Deltaproteobacteria bacterium]
MTRTRLRATSWIFTAAIALSASQALAQAMVRIGPGFQPDPLVLTGRAGGPIEASGLGSDCRGNNPARPQHTLVVTQPTNLRILTAAENNTDVTLAIVGPRGAQCDDDHGGSMQSLIEGTLMPGMYRIFVGSFAASEFPAYSLILTTNPAVNSDNFARMSGRTPVVVPNNPNSPWNGNQVPTPPPNNPPPNSGNVVLNRLSRLRPTGGSVALSGRATRRARGRSGGTVEAHTLDSNCRGYVFTPPTWNVNVSAPAGDVRFMVTSAADTTLMVRTPSGAVMCNDDANGLNPMVTVSNAEIGQYTVWVGIYQPNSRNLYQLTATTDPGVTR